MVKINCSIIVAQLLRQNWNRRNFSTRITIHFDIGRWPICTHERQNMLSNPDELGLHALQFASAPTGRGLPLIKTLDGLTLTTESQ